MRVLVEAVGEVGQRTANILLAESRVEYIGVWNDRSTRRTRRSGPADSIDGYDIALSDSSHPRAELVARCSVAGIPIVLWADAPHIAPGASVVPIVTAANVGSALTAALLTHPAARPVDDEPTLVAWTEPGKRDRRGERIIFPDPIGVSTARERAPGMFVAHRSDEWAGAVVRVGPPEAPRVVGVADHAGHLEALVLAATTLITAEGAFAPGVHAAAERGEQLLNALRNVELDIAAWRSSS